MVYVLSLIFILSLSVTAFAAKEDGKAEKDGVKVTVTPDKSSYKSGDLATYNVTVENTNDYDVSNVRVELLGGNKAKLSQKDSDKLVVDSILAGKSVTIKVAAVMNSDSKAPASDFPIALIIGIVAAVVVILLVIVFIVKKKKGKKVVASCLVVGMLTSSLFTPLTAKAISVHDPSVVKDEESGDYYIFGSHLGFAKTSDLINWSSVSLNLNGQYKTLFEDIWNNYCSTQKNSDLSGNMWAPDVIYNDTMKKWCMYMSINGNDWHSAIVLLTADKIDGPYEYVDEVVFSGFSGEGEGSAASMVTTSKKVTVNTEEVKVNFKVYFSEGGSASRADYSDVYKVLGEGANLSAYTSTDKSCVNAIDPNVQYDDNGDLWMTYGSWSAGIYQLKLDTQTGLRDYNFTYQDEINVSDPYLGYKIAGGFYNSGEGPYILKADKYYYLFVSLGNLEASGGYNMRVFRSENINGPYVDQKGNSAIYKSFDPSAGYKDIGATSKYNTGKGIKIFGSYRMYGVGKIQVAQGHNSAIEDDGKLYLVYHTRYASNGEGHEVKVHQMFINEDGWLVAAPYAYSGETIAKDGYSAKDIAGNYQFIVHDHSKVYVNGTNGETGIVEPVDITLSEDGKVTGSLTGTWKSTTGPNVVLNIGDREYKGVFLKQKTETTQEEIMTFTVLGDNETAWGVRAADKN